VLDAGLERKVVQKSGSYFSFEDERLGQGRQNATSFLREHPDVTDGIVRRIQEQLGEDQIVSARLLPVAEAADQATAAKKKAAAAAMGADVPGTDDSAGEEVEEPVEA
jgi:recombination protein RecA